MKCFSSSQIRQLDSITSKRESLSSIDLMERAGRALSLRIEEIVPQKAQVAVLVGPGNNGGDGMVIARQLHQQGYRVQVVLCNYGKVVSPDATFQLKQLQQVKGVNVISPTTAEELNHRVHADWLVDALFGTGLNRPLMGAFEETVEWINRQQAGCISIDLPSGLFGEDNSKREDTTIVRAAITLGLQCPRLAFFLAENEAFIGKWELINIGLNKEALRQLETPWSLTTPEEVALLLKKRRHFAHKGQFGHTLLIAGSRGMTGACILAGRGALRAGTGLLTLKVPDGCLNIVQTALPEAMAKTYTHSFWDETDHIDTWTGIAVGPGLGTAENTGEALDRLFSQQPKRLVLDADALNVMALKRTLLEKIPVNAILTPHPGEFDRLTKPHKTGFERLQTAIEFTNHYGVYLILKGAYSACIAPQGTCRFNLTGNPGMATGGSGDVLTGIVVSLLSQGYTHEEACIVGTCLHGLSGDLALDNESQESLLASDIAANLGNAFRYLKKTAHTETV